MTSVFAAQAETAAGHTGDESRATTHLIIGPDDHGVVIFARWLAERTGTRYVRLPGPDSFDDVVAAQVCHGSGSVHLHYTEALYGPDTITAAGIFGRLRAALPIPVSVTLHDLPDPGDEPSRYARRTAGYRAVAHAADRVCVSSSHESALLQRFAPDVRPDVIPLPMAGNPLVRPSERPEPVPEIAVFGFVYPGKGHAQVLQEMSGLPDGIPLTAIGRAADGHADLIQELARSAGRSFSVTGFVSSGNLLPRLRQAAVPVVPATAISASGSLNTWIEAGRRPLVAEGPYARELAEAWPAGMTLYRPGEFAGAARAVLESPALSWLEDLPPQRFREDSVAQAYLGVFEGNQ